MIRITLRQSLLLMVLISLAALKKTNAQVVAIHNLYVAVNGDDNNPGTLKLPYRSLNKALIASCLYKGKQVVILLKGGTHYLDKTIVLKPGDVPVGGLIITGYKNKKATISAGRKLALKWKPYRNGIYRATIPAGISFERLYINGDNEHLARYPNYDSTARIYNGTTADAIAPERVKNWKNPAGGYLHALHAGEWGSFDYRIDGKDNDGNLILTGGWQNNRPAPLHKQFRFVENIFEELDAPGEWYLNKQEHSLYFYPPKNVNINTALVEVSRLKNSIELKGTVGEPVRNVKFRNLDFKHNERSFMDTKEPLLRSDWTIYRGGAILFDGTENCAITDCSFTGLGGNAIMVSNYNLHATITGCYVAHIGASAVCFVGNPAAVRSPLFRYEDKLPYEKIDKTPGPLTNDYPQECVVTDNLFHNLGEIEKQATGVEITMSSGITVTHNSIYNTPRAGINIGDGCWGGHTLAYNDVFNTVLETGDHGAFNSWGRDRYWTSDKDQTDKLVELHPGLILLDAQKQNTIHDNRFRCDHGWDIDLDDGSSNYHIYNNLCLNGGLKLREGYYRIVENNIIINNSFHPHVWFKNSGDVFEHNIVAKKYFPIGIEYWGKSVDYNFFPDTVALGQSRRNGTDAHSIAGNAMFINPAKGDFAVLPTSGAIKGGFKNFPMNEFGVQKPFLKKIALQPLIPELLTAKQSKDRSAVVPFLGGKIKTVDGLGERSAYGLPDENGVIIIDAGKNSLLSKSGLNSKDVIRLANDKPIKTIEDLLEIYQAESWKPKIQIEIIRNQQPLKLWLLLR